MYKSIRTTLPFVFAGILVAGSAVAQDKPAAKPAASGGSVATVNGQAIPAVRMEMLVRQATTQGQPDSAELRGAIKEELINREIVVQEALRRGMDKSSEYATQMDLLRHQVLFQMYLQDYARANQPKDADLRAEYDRIKASRGDKEYRARHILVKTEEEAREVLGQLGKGGKFEQIASEKSLDPGSKTTGGDLNWAPSSAYVKPFADALVKLKRGEMTRTPVQTQFGWHVIQLQEDRPTKLPGFEEVKPQIAQRLTQQTLQKAVSDLRAKAKVTE
jgi:peptidyl-prolyl cis-trans isomerase C